MTVAPATSSSKPTLDFAKPFTYVFEDPRWLSKILIGGLLYLAIVVIVGPFFVAGYCARLIRNVIAGEPRPLPEWDRMGEYFGEGLRLAGVVLVYMAPLMIFIGFMIVPAIIAGALSQDSHDAAASVGSAFSGCAGCVMFPFSLALSLWMPAAMLMTVVDQRFGAAFQFGRIWAFIRNNLANYILAFVVAYVARFVAGFGLILLCIGFFFTAFYSLLVASFAYGEAYRLSQQMPAVPVSLPVIPPPPPPPPVPY